MKTNYSFLFRWSGRLATLPLCLGATVSAAPLTWFPGPRLNQAVSGAATTASSGLGNILIGGDYFYTSYTASLGATNSNWTPLPTLYGVRIAGGAAGNGDPILVFGGTDGTTSQSTAAYYSPSADAVSEAGSMSVARSYLGYASDHDGKAYAFGGLDDAGNVLSSAEVFSMESSNSSWSSIASLPSGRYNFPAASDGKGYIYVFGGGTNQTSGAEIASVLRYSVSGNSWTSVAPLPVAVAGSGAAFGVDGKFYVVGGVAGGVTTNVVQVYSPTSNTWAISTPLLEGLSASAMSVDSLGRLILMGGADTNGNDVNHVWRSQRLGTPDSPPVLTQFPTTNANYQVTYTSTIGGTGNPQPVFLLASGPTNMTVDYFSGQITWTPFGGAQIGSIPVTITATNYAGATNYSFTIQAAPPLPSTPTNVTVVSATDTSVTLTWAPEDPLVGPVTFTVYWVHSSGPHGGTTYTLEATTSSNSVTLPFAMGTSHALELKASANGHTSGFSASVVATTTRPQPPTNARLTGVTSTTLSLAWDASPGPTQNPNFSPITSYSIVQYIPGGALVPKATGITGTSGTVTGLTPNSSAFWTVEAFDPEGNGAYSSLDLVAVTNPIPVPPVLNGAVQLADGSFQFTASESGSAVQTVLIQASANLADPNSWVQIGSVYPGTNTFTFTDTNAFQFPTRFYRMVVQ
jgi:N-acetylneuraminic acid mutarotase